MDLSLSFQLPCFLPYVTVRGHVRVEVGYVAECLVADRALEGCCRGVGCLVLLQVRLLSKPLVTH